MTITNYSVIRDDLQSSIYQTHYIVAHDDNPTWGDYIYLTCPNRQTAITVASALNATL